MGVCGTFLAVDEMRRGASPDGCWSSAALRPGFKVAVKTADHDELVDAGQVLLAGD